MGADLPAAGQYATGILMMDPEISDKVEEMFVRLADQCGIQVRRAISSRPPVVLVRPESNGIASFWTTLSLFFFFFDPSQKC